MANSKQQPAQQPLRPASAQGFKFKGYVNVSLRKSDQEALTEWAKQQPAVELLDMLYKLADSGYKFSIGESASGLIATLSNIDGPKETVGYILSARSTLAWKALVKLLYVHYMMLEEDWSSVAGPAGDDDF